MKHVALLGALAFSSVFAAEVSPNDALCAVKGWMNLKEALGCDFDASPAFVTAYDGEAGKGKFYVVALEGGGYVVASGTHNAGTETITVVDRLCVNDFANGTSKIHTSRLAGGATLDLSALDTAWIPKSVFSSSGTNYVTFAENAEISVDLGERPVRSIATSSDPYIVKWNDAPQPSATTKFSLTSAEGNATSYRLRADATGLKVFFTPGFALTIK